MIYCDVLRLSRNHRGSHVNIRCLKHINQPATSAAEHEGFKSCATLPAETSQRLRLLKAVSWWQSCGKVQLPSLAPMDCIISYFSDVFKFVCAQHRFYWYSEDDIYDIHASHSTLPSSLDFFFQSLANCQFACAVFNNSLHPALDQAMWVELHAVVSDQSEDRAIALIPPIILYAL